MSQPLSSEGSCSGDQGFINAYFEDFVNAPLFDPEDIPKDAKVKVGIPVGLLWEV